MSSDDARAEPDSFVGVAPTTWGFDNARNLPEVHASTWQQEIGLELEETDGDAPRARGSIEFPDGYELTLLLEDPISDLVEMVPTSKEPYTPSDTILIKEHSATWRFVAPDGAELRKDAAKKFARLCSTFVEAGSAGIFMPGIAALHSPRFIKKITMDLSHPQAITNLCVNCWDEDDWMATRGLTSFGLPELETPIEQGANASYFRLMDIAADMINRGSAYPVGGNLNVGPESLEVEEGRQGPADQQIPIAGTFGVLTVRPS